MTEDNKDGIILQDNDDPNRTIEAVRAVIKRKEGQVAFAIALGDLTEVSVDAIVSPANPGFEYVGNGVQGAISDKTGMGIFDEAETNAQKYIRQTGGVKGPEGPTGTPLGFAFSTRTDKLPGIKSVIHVNNFRVDKDPPCDEEVIRVAVYSSLLEAERTGMASVAFPAMGTGLWGMTTVESLNGTVMGVHDYFQDNPGSKVKKVDFVVYAEATQKNARLMQSYLFNDVFPGIPPIR